MFAFAVAMVIASCGCSVTVDSGHAHERSSVSDGKESTSSFETTNINLLRLELRPTASLVEERMRQRRRDRQRQLSGEKLDANNISWSISEEEEFPEQWFHPHVRAVYATLHPLKRNNSEGEISTLAEQHYKDFVQYRHLSRFERHFRESLGLDLHPNWSGNYSNSEDIFREFHDSDILREEILNRSSESTATHHRELLESLVGGKFDQYQGVPLSQGYGTHYVHLWVGSPVPQRQSVIVDTGSHFTGFPVAGECVNCGEDHHTDPHFDPALSETFQTLRCPAECVETFECERPATTTELKVGDTTNTSNYFFRHRRNNYPRCSFTQAYTEGSSWTAYQARDIVYCGSGANLIEAVDPLDTKYSLRFLFGCLKANTGLFVTQLADGIMGMSAHELTLPKQLYNERKVEYNMFAMCFRKELGTSKKGVTAGSMTLGGVSSALDTSPMVYARNIRPYGWYTVYVEKIYIATKGGTKFLFDDPSKTPTTIMDEHSIVPLLGFEPSEVNRDRGVIVDSGTTDTYLSSTVRKEFTSAWKRATGFEYSNSAVYLTQEQLKNLPTLLVQLQASVTIPLPSNETTRASFSKPVLGQVGYLDPDHTGDVLLAIPATSYMEYSPTIKLYTSRLFFTESRGGVIGANAMQGHNILFDWQHGRIGFAHSSCNYDLIAGKNDNHGDFRESSTTEGSEDTCIFFNHGSLPILTQTCLQSVSNNQNSMAICRASDSPTNVEIEGLEIWTLRVKNPGTDPSKCKTAILKWSEAIDTHNQVDASTTSCTPDGLCQEYRPCHVPCLTAIDYHNSHTKHHADANSNTSSPFIDEAVTIPYPVINRTESAENEDVDSENLCSDWTWTACDYSCHQSRISSSKMITHAFGGYCLESNRESRSCHIGACGRSDPCIVPFLVHAIFILEGRPFRGIRNEKVRESPSEPPPYWTPKVEEEFRRRLVSAAHHPEVHKSSDYRNETRLLFEEGDIEILVARPWYGDKDEISDFDSINRTDAIGLDTRYDEAALGTQLILQISIPNRKAKMKQLESLEGYGRRKLLQEVGVVWSNFTQVFRKSWTTSVCNPFDLYPLAKTANLVADEILSNPRLLSLLVTENNSNLDDDNNENFQWHTAKDKKGLKGFHSVRLVSSWTIGTQIYDDSGTYVFYFFPLQRMDEYIYNRTY